MKMLMAWHEGCLRNRKISYQRQVEELERLKARVEQSRIDCVRYEEQIIEAKKRGLDGFDQDRFMKNKTMKGEKENGC
jgi:hypothetical protein